MAFAGDHHAFRDVPMMVHYASRVKALFLWYNFVDFIQFGKSEYTLNEDLPRSIRKRADIVEG